MYVCMDACPDGSSILPASTIPERVKAIGKAEGFMRPEAQYRVGHNHLIPARRNVLLLVCQGTVLPRLAVE